MNPKKVKCICFMLVLLLVLSAWVYRFYTINATSEQVQIEYHKSGEVVLVEDNFFYTKDEKNYGYEFIVKGGKVKTLEEFLSENGAERDYLKKGNTSAYEPNYVYDVEVTVRNVGNTSQCGFNLIGLVLCAYDNQIQVNAKLFDLLYPQLNNMYGFAVKPDTEMTLHFPYTAVEVYNDMCDYDYYTEEALFLTISWYPVENRIWVDNLN